MLVLNSGPSPSRAAVDDGADTHGLRKKLLPTLKVSWRTGVKLADGMEKASALVTVVVALPPDKTSRVSNGAVSGLQPANIRDRGNKKNATRNETGVRFLLGRQCKVLLK